VELTASERESLRKILRAVYLSDWGSQIVADAHAVLAKLERCPRCTRRMSKSMGCPDECEEQ
jgi:hypothetical protein